MKVIFLDIDGVLNWVGSKDRICGFVGLDPTRIERFNRIIEAHPDAKIVVSSTWRHSRMPGVYEDFDGLKVLLKERGLKGEIIDLTVKDYRLCSRGSEIRQWVDDWEKDHPGEILNYVILDDDTSGMEGWIEEEGIWYNYGSGSEGWSPRQEFRDLRHRHVVTFWDGEEGSGYNEPGLEGGLQDYHIEKAIKLLESP